MTPEEKLAAIQKDLEDVDIYYDQYDCAEYETGKWQLATSLLKKYFEQDSDPRQLELNLPPNCS